MIWRRRHTGPEENKYRDPSHNQGQRWRELQRGWQMRTRAALVGAWLWQTEPKAVGEPDKRDEWKGEINDNSFENGYSRTRLDLQLMHKSTNDNNNRGIESRLPSKTPRQKMHNRREHKSRHRLSTSFSFSLFSLSLLPLFTHTGTPPICLSLQPIMGNPCSAPW